ncbi:hypothetical protein D4S03_05665 [bacterium]|nr:MAG: hypothetical protein D4S03_05665 [bacterium]
MGIFDRIFKNKKSNISPAAEKVFDKLYNFLSDDALQISNLPLALTNKFKEGVDQIPNGIGEFGRSINNPIPVNGPIGEVVYLSRLATEDTSKLIIFHRLGSVENIDVYETVSIDGLKWDILFLDFYYKSKSSICPTGYKVVNIKIQPMIYGTNSRIIDFPIGIGDAVNQFSRTIIGFPLVSKELRIAEETIKYNRDSSHILKIKRLEESGITLAPLYSELKPKKQGDISNYKDHKKVTEANTSVSIEPALVIMLGPPSDNEQKIMFEKYQEAFNINNVEDSKDWENFEKYMLNKLFSRKNNQSSQIEELFYRLLKVPIKINDYKFVFGNHQNKWVAGFSIPSSAVIFDNIPNMKWPPKKEIMGTAADVFGYALQREWVFVYSIIPPKDNNANAEGLHQSVHNDTITCNHCGSVVGIDSIECPTCNRPIG